MGKTITITKPIIAADFMTMDTGIANIQEIIDASSIVLTTSESSSLIGVSTNRAAEITEVKETVVDKHPTALPANTTAAGFIADQAYIASLKKTHTGLVDQAAKMQVLITAGENNLYIKTGTIMKNVKLLGETDKVLADIGKAISDKYHPHTVGKTGATNVKIGPLVVITQAVVPRKMFTNKAKAVLSILEVGGNINDAIMVNPFSGVAIPDTWHNIVITNLSGTEPGSFDIFTK